MHQNKDLSLQKEKEKAVKGFRIGKGGRWKKGRCHFSLWKSTGIRCEPYVKDQIVTRKRKELI